MSSLRNLLGRGPLASQRGRLIAILVIATAAITALAFQAFDGAYYTTPEEFAQEIDAEGRRWRVGGRVVDGTIVEQNGRPVSWVIEGEAGETMRIEYDGVVPGLFAPRAFVVVEGVAAGEGLLLATSVIIRHEPEFVTDAEDASIAAP
ncbi:MAG: cytochrome c maturation protein CcmE [Chloroflexi bacterium]|nr:cytochrome c maturation protein CcmE [Chloroflexota bacterium]